MTDENLWIDTETQPLVGSAEVGRVLSAQLRVVHPPELTAQPPIPVTAMAIVLGRSEGRGATDVVAHGTVSRSHFRVVYEPLGDVHVGVDLGSHNGTKINGHVVAPDEEVALADGATIRLGGVLLVYERTDGRDAPDTADDARLIGAAPEMIRLRNDVERAAADVSPVLLIGETGTGKEHIGRELHRKSGRSGPLVPVNCAELSANLVESQLFGHKRGAFTGAAETSQGLFRSADRGTLFLDEIGELPLELQPKLLRVLEEGVVRPVGSTATHAVDVRVIAATNRDLAVMVEEGTFRRDLRARLGMWELRAPPLRARRSDLLRWFHLFAAQWAEERGFSAFSLVFEVDAAEQLMLHDWPDNLREVNRFVHRFAEAAREGNAVTLADVQALLPPPDRRKARHQLKSQPHTPLPAAPSAIPVQAPTAFAARSKPQRPAPSAEELQKTLHELGSVRATAKHYGRDRKQIYRWIKRYAISWNG